MLSAGAYGKGILYWFFIFHIKLTAYIELLLCLLLTTGLSTGTPSKCNIYQDNYSLHSVGLLDSKWGRIQEEGFRWHGELGKSTWHLYKSSPAEGECLPRNCGDEQGTMLPPYYEYSYAGEYLMLSNCRSTWPSCWKFYKICKNSYIPKIRDFGGR